MELRQITSDISVSPQIGADDMAEIKAQGFRALICNRPDVEGEGQPAFAEIEAAAEAHGLAARYVPVQSGGVTQADVAAFEAALADLPRPLLAYCRSGARSATLWSLHEDRLRAASGLPAAAE